MPEELNRKLDLARRDLLDLGLRNTLLNHQPLRSRGAEVTGASPAEVFRLLVTEGRSLPLKPAEPPPPAPPPRSGRGEPCCPGFGGACGGRGAPSGGGQGRRSI